MRYCKGIRGRKMDHDVIQKRESGEGTSIIMECKRGH